MEPGYLGIEIWTRGGKHYFANAVQKSKFAIDFDRRTRSDAVAERILEWSAGQPDSTR